MRKYKLPELKEEIIEGYHAIGYLKACEDFHDYLVQIGFPSENINDAISTLLARYRKRYP